MSSASPPPRRAFKVSSRLEAGRTVVAVTGELDMATAPDLDRALAGATDGGATGIVVDLSACTFIDSTAITTLLRRHRGLADGKGDGAHGLTVAGAGGQVRPTLELASVDEVIELTG